MIYKNDVVDLGEGCFVAEFCKTTRYQFKL